MHAPYTTSPKQQPGDLASTACSALRAAREIEDEADELRLPLEARARALERSVARLEAAAALRGGLLRRAGAGGDLVAAFAEAAKGLFAAEEASRAAERCAAALGGGSGGGGGGAALRGLRWFASLRVKAKQRRPPRLLAADEEAAIAPNVG